MMNTPELRKRARELGLTVTIKTKRSRRYKTNAELMNEISQQNILLKQLQNMIRQGNKQMPRNKNNTNNNYNRKRANILFTK